MRSPKDQRHLPGAEIPRDSGVGCVKFRVVGQVAFLAEGGEVLVGVVGGVVIQVGDGQDDDHRLAVFDVVIEAKILFGPCVGASFHHRAARFCDDDGVILETAFFAAVAISLEDSRADFRLPVARVFGPIAGHRFGVIRGEQVAAGQPPGTSFGKAESSVGGASASAFGREGRGIHRFRLLECSVSHSSHVLSGPSTIGDFWIVAKHHTPSYSSHTAKHAQGHPKSPRIGVPSCGAVSGGNQPAEQGDAERPPLALLFAAVSGFDFDFLAGIALGLRGRWGRQVLDVQPRPHFSHEVLGAWVTDVQLGIVLGFASVTDRHPASTADAFIGVLFGGIEVSTQPPRLNKALI